MLDPAHVREHLDEVRTGFRNRGLDPDAILGPFTELDGKRPVIGSWVVGQEAAGMGIRESDGWVTGNGSRFVPHVLR